jgi:hypothetical protein
MLLKPDQKPAESVPCKRCNLYCMTGCKSFTPLILITILPFIPMLCKAGNEHEPASARALGVARSCIVLTDCWALINNIGALEAEKNQFTLGLYSGSSWTNITGVSAIVATKKIEHDINMGLGVVRSGSDLYNEIRIIGGASHKIGWTKLGISGTYLRNQTKNLISTESFFIEMGGTARYKNLVLGLHLYNISNSSIGTDRYMAKIPPAIRAGFSYSILNNKLTLLGECYKTPNQKTMARIGAEYCIDTNMISVKCGYEAITNVGAIGVGFQNKKMNISVSGLTHSAFGLTIMLSAEIKLNYYPAKKTKPPTNK